MLKLLRRIGLGHVSSSLISGCLILSYSIMTGFGTSAVRALMMFSLQLLADCIGRTYDTLSALSLAAVTILIEHPFYLYQAGFQLSFGAIMGIALVYPVFAEVKLRIQERAQKRFYKSWMDPGVGLYGSRRDRYCYRMLHLITGVLDAVLIGLSIQIATLPIILWNYYSIPIYGIWLNLLIVPFVVFLFGFGVTGGILGLICPWLARSFLIPCQWILMFYDEISRKSLSLPCSQWIIGKPTLWQMILYDLVLLMLLFCFYHFKRSNKYIEYESIDQKTVYRKKQFILFVTLAAGYMIVFLILITRIQGEFSLSMLSVGQGECTVIWGKKIPTILIDGGSTDTQKIWKYRMVPFLKANGISQIDYIFISHCDMDHISGILEAMEEINNGVCEIKIKNILLPYKEQSLMDADKNASRLYESTMKTDVILYGFTKGDELQFDDLKIECLHPLVDAYQLGRADEDDQGDRSDQVATVDGIVDRNLQSMVLQMTTPKLQILFTGDIDQGVEQEIVKEIKQGIGQKQKQVKNIEEKGDFVVHILKVAHHGSKNGTSDTLLDVFSPDFAMISCGKKNRYGHPSDETCNRLKQHHIKYEVTKEKGCISIEVSKDEIVTDTFLK
ncbi:MAG: MBL fold metallo-hydrolase [Clostridia bacterium]|nr:MBL fold metallo-hydrolase [Clostridia bacterium]